MVIGQVLDQFEVSDRNNVGRYEIIIENRENIDFLHNRLV